MASIYNEPQNRLSPLSYLGTDGEIDIPIHTVFPSDRFQEVCLD